MLPDPMAPLSIRWSYLPSLMGWLTRFVQASRPDRVDQISADLSSILHLLWPAYRGFSRKPISTA